MKFETQQFANEFNLKVAFLYFGNFICFRHFNRILVMPGCYSYEFILLNLIE